MLHLATSPGGDSVVLIVSDCVRDGATRVLSGSQDWMMMTFSGHSPVRMRVDSVQDCVPDSSFSELTTEIYWMNFFDFRYVRATSSGALPSRSI
jgi:hypothetical protein